VGRKQANLHAITAWCAISFCLFPVSLFPFSVSSSSSPIASLASVVLLKILGSHSNLEKSQSFGVADYRGDDAMANE
jgi:hypothetical protein